MSEVKICPHCRREIEYIIGRFNTTGWEDADCDFEGIAEDITDSGTDDSELDYYYCPSCSHHLSPEDLIDPNEEDENGDETSPTDKIDSEIRKRVDEMKSRRTGWNLDRESKELV